MQKEIERKLKEMEEREKKRKRFFKKQQKIYCNLIWTGLAQENKEQLDKTEETYNSENSNISINPQK